MLNKVILIGKLTRDPEMRHTGDGTPVVNLNLATWERRKNADGTRKSITEYHTLVCWNKLATIAGEYLKKDSMIYVEGRIEKRSFEGRDGEKKQSTQIVVRDFRMFPQMAHVGDNQGTNDEPDFPHEEEGEQEGNDG